MKKILVILTALAIILTVNTTVFAEPGSFVVSPSANGAPTLVEEESSDNLKIVSYRDRHDELEDHHVSHFEDAYSSIATADGVSNIIASVANIAAELNVSVDELAVSDLFYITYEDGSEHVDGEQHKVVFNAKTLGNFVCLMHYYDGIWHIVADASLLNNGSLEFTADNLGPYAIVVSTGDAPVYPEIPDAVSPWAVAGIVTAALVVVAGACLIVLMVIKKRKKNA